MSDKRFQCNVCLRSYPPEQLYRPEGYLAAPILCDTCGVGIARYWAMQDELYRAQVVLLQEIQADMLLQLQQSQMLTREADRVRRLQERRAAKIARQTVDDGDLIAQPPRREHPLK